MNKQSHYQEIEDFDREHGKDGPGIFLPGSRSVIFPDGAIRSQRDSSGCSGWLNPQPSADPYERAQMVVQYWSEVTAKAIAEFSELRAAVGGSGLLPNAFADPASARKELTRLRDIARRHQAKLNDARETLETNKPAQMRQGEARQLTEQVLRQNLRAVAGEIKL